MRITTAFTIAPFIVLLSGALCLCQQVPIANCLEEEPKDCPAFNICGDVPCNPNITWALHPTLEDVLVPVFNDQCPSGTKGRHSDSPIQTKQDCAKDDVEEGYKEINQETHTCYFIRHCALACTTTTEEIDYIPFRWAPNSGHSGSPGGGYPLLASFCNEGVQTGVPEILVYASCAGELRGDCNPLIP